MSNPEIIELSRPVRRIAVTAALSISLCAIALVWVVDKIEHRPREYRSYYFEIPGGGRIRNDTWVEPAQSWVDPELRPSELFYEDPHSGRAERIESRTEDGTTLRDAGKVEALRSGDHVDLLFGDSLYARRSGRWARFRLFPEDLLARSYVEVPPEASAKNWVKNLGRARCRAVDVNFLQHWVAAHCMLRRGDRPVLAYNRRLPGSAGEAVEV